MVTCQEETEGHTGQEGVVAPVAGLMEDHEHEAEAGGSGDVGQGGSLNARQGGSHDAGQEGSHVSNPDNSVNPNNSRTTTDNFDNLLGEYDLDDIEYNQIVNDVGNISFSY